MIITFFFFLINEKKKKRLLLNTRNIYIINILRTHTCNLFNPYIH